LAGVTAIETRLGGAPVPLKLTVCGLLFALSVKVNVPLREPCTFGENVTEAVQLAPAASVAGQLELTAKSLRLLVIALMLSEVDWLLVSVTVCATLDVPNAWLGKVKLPGLATAATIPVPVRLAVGLTLALSLMVSVALRVPTTVGEKKTDTLQLDPAARLFGLIGQVVVVV